MVERVDEAVKVKRHNCTETQKRSVILKDTSNKTIEVRMGPRHGSLSPRRATWCLRLRGCATAAAVSCVAVLSVAFFLPLCYLPPASPCS